MRNASFYSSKRITAEEAFTLEGYHLEYEKLIHDMFCDPQWVIRFGKQKKLRVLTYCMYYQGITARQLLLTNVTPEAELDSERVFLGRLTAAHMLHVTSFRLPGNEPAVVYLMTPEGAKFCRNKLLQLIRTRGLPVSESAVEAVFARFGKLTPVTSVGHFLSVRDIHAYLLSQFVATPFHYGIECGVYLSGEVMSIADSLTGAMSGARRRQVAFVSDAVLTYPSSDAMSLTAAPAASDRSGISNISNTSDMTSTDVHMRHDDGIYSDPYENGQENKEETQGVQEESNVRSAPFNPSSPDNCYVYIEQDMSTQHLNVLSGKIGNYTRYIAMQKRHPAKHTLIFSLQTRSSDSSGTPKRKDKPDVKPTATAAPSVTDPRMGTDAYSDSSGAGMFFSSGTPIDTGAGAHLGPAGMDPRGESWSGATVAPAAVSAKVPGLDLTRYIRQECLTSVPAVAYAYYGEAWTDTPIAVLADIYESFNGNIGYMERRYSNAAKTLRLASSDMPEATIGELFDGIREYSASLGERKENEKEKRHHALYLARKATFQRAVSGTDGLHEMFLRGFSIATSHNRAHERIVPFLLPQISPDMASHLKSLCNLYMGTDFNETPVYRDYVESPSYTLTLRNCYTWSNGTVVYLENISDDFGGRARLLQYLSDGRWDGPEGYLICLVADDDTSYLKEISRSTFYRELTGDQQMMVSLKVTYITYTQFTQARGLSYYSAYEPSHSSGSSAADTAPEESSAFCGTGSSRVHGEHGELVPLLPYGYGGG